MPSPALHPLVEAILAPSPDAKVGALERFAARASFAELVNATAMLHAFAGDATVNPYQRVRALLQLYAPLSLLSARAPGAADNRPRPVRGPAALARPTLPRGH